MCVVLFALCLIVFVCLSLQRYCHSGCQVWRRQERLAFGKFVCPLKLDCFCVKFVFIVCVLSLLRVLGSCSQPNSRLVVAHLSSCSKAKCCLASMRCQRNEIFLALFSRAATAKNILGLLWCQTELIDPQTIISKNMVFFSSFDHTCISAICFLTLSNI